MTTPTPCKTPGHTAYAVKDGLCGRCLTKRWHALKARRKAVDERVREIVAVCGTLDVLGRLT